MNVCSNKGSVGCVLRTEWVNIANQDGAWDAPYIANQDGAWDAPYIAELFLFEEGGQGKDLAHPT